MPSRSKKDDIIKTAGELFVREGFRKVSVDQIAEAVPVSKPTLYAHFVDKKALFSSVIEHRCHLLIAKIRSGVDANMAPKEALGGIGRQFLEAVISIEAIRMHRIIAAESAEFPEIAKLFYESGPKQMHAVLSTYLAQLHRDKILKVEDAPLSADLFLGMLKGHLHLRCMMGVQAPPSKAEIKKRVEYAVRMFLGAHSR